MHFLFEFFVALFYKTNKNKMLLLSNLFFNIYYSYFGNVFVYQIYIFLFKLMQGQYRITDCQ